MTIHDIQQQDAGGGEEDYARPFGTLETKEESLGFKDPQIAHGPSRLKRLGHWMYRHLYRPWR